MLRLSKKADYALLAMRHLAAHPERGAVSARELAECLRHPVRAARQGAAEARARRGCSNRTRASAAAMGWRGRRPISVAEVIQAIDGPLTVTACSEDDQSCDQYAKCGIRDPLWQIKDRIVSALAATSVSGSGGRHAAAASDVRADGSVPRCRR